MRVLITAPSLDEKRNVSGISTIARQIIDYGTYDYIHFTAGREDGEKAGLGWLIKQAVLPIRFYKLIRASDADIVHINTALTDLSIWRDAALAFVAKLSGRKLVLAIHGGKYLMNEFSSRSLRKFTTGMLRRADVVVIYSEYEKSELLRRWQGLDVRILPNAVPFGEVPRHASKNERPVMIYFGRMHESKGLHEIIEACGILKKEGMNFDFRTYGEGPLRDFFVNGMREALGSSFEYGGIITSKEKWNKLAAADIFVLPSRYGEGLPMAMLEAMATGCVVVASDIASVKSVVSNGENGYIVEPQNIDQLVKTLKNILKNPDAWPAMQQASIDTVKNNFGINEYIERLEKIYTDAASRNNQ